MRIGVIKREKTTAIHFDEYDSIIEVQAFKTEKRRLELPIDCII